MESEFIKIPKNLVLFGDVEAIAMYAYIKLLGHFDFDMIKTRLEMQADELEATLLDLISDGYLDISLKNG